MNDLANQSLRYHKYTQNRTFSPPSNTLVSAHNDEDPEYNYSIDGGCPHVWIGPFCLKIMAELYDAHVEPNRSNDADDKK